MDVGMKLGLARGLGPAQRSATWLLLKHYNDTTGYCCPKIATLAAAEDISDSAMGRTLFRLMENSCWERRLVGILYHYDLPPAIASTIVATKTAHDAGVIFDIESHYHNELARLGSAKNRPHFGSIEHLNTDHGVNDTDHGVNDTDHGVNDTDHHDRSERRKKEVRKDVRKEASSPRPALVPAATLTAPETAAAVYNTLEIEKQEEPAMDDVTRARAAELIEIEKEIGTQLRDGSLQHADEYQQARDQLADTRSRRLHLETQLSDEEWHVRARNAAATGSERLVDVIAALVVQRWPDFPYRIEWRQRLHQMVEAYRAAGRRGRYLLDDVLTASAAADKDMALMMLVSHWLEKEDTTADDRDEDQAVRPLPAEQGSDGVLRQQGRQGRSAVPVQSLSTSDTTRAQGNTDPPPVATERNLPALQEAEAAEPVPHPQPPQKWPLPAVQSVP